MIPMPVSLPVSVPRMQTKTPAKTPGLAVDLPEDIENVDTSLIERFAGYAARRASLAIVERFVSAMAVHELRPVTFTLLTLIGSNAGITSSQLCALLDIHSSNLVGLVKQLHDRALIRRRPHPRDGRAMGLHLTAAGQCLLDKALKTAAQADQQATAALSACELQELLRLLRKVYAPGRPG